MNLERSAETCSAEMPTHVRIERTLISTTEHLITLSYLNNCHCQRLTPSFPSSSHESLISSAVKDVHCQTMWRAPAVFQRRITYLVPKINTLHRLPVALIHINGRSHVTGTCRSGTRRSTRGGASRLQVLVCGFQAALDISVGNNQHRHLVATQQQDLLRHTCTALLTFKAPQLQGVTYFDPQRRLVAAQRQDLYQQTCTVRSLLTTSRLQGFKMFDTGATKRFFSINAASEKIISIDQQKWRRQHQLMATGRTDAGRRIESACAPAPSPIRAQFSQGHLP